MGPATADLERPGTRVLTLLACVLVLLGSAVVVVGVAVPVPADAADTAVVGATANTFVPFETFVDEGGSLTFVHADVEPHDVTSREFGPDGRPLFSSATIGAGTAPVNGVEELAPGTYSFFCTVHDWMSGLLTVEDTTEPDPEPEPDPVPLPSDLPTEPSEPGIPDTDLPVPVPVAAGIETPTSIAVHDGALYAASFLTGTVSSLPILPGGLLGEPSTYATGLSSPLGIAFGPDGTMFVSDSSSSTRPGRTTDGRVWAIPPGGGSTADVGEVVISELPNGRHNTNGMAVRGGRLYITNGNSTDDGVSGGEPEEPLSGTLLSVPLEARGLTPATAGADLVVEATGMRNIYDIAFRSDTPEAWLPMNGPDALDPFGEDLLLRATVFEPAQDARADLPAAADAREPRAAHGRPDIAATWTPDDFGFPGCVYAAGDDGPLVEQNPAVADTDPCDGSEKPPEQLLGLHTSADGLAFGPDDSYWDGDLFIAMFGSLDPTTPAGHKVVRVPIDAEGNASPPSDVFPSAAPLDVTFGPPGTGLYVADFSTGQIILLRAPDLTS